MNLSDAIRIRRKELGLTLKDLADKIGVAEATVQRYESGNIKNVRHERIVKIAAALEMSPTDLMGWETEKPAANKGDELTDIEREYIRLFRVASPEMQAAAHGMLEAAEKARLARDSSAKDK